MYPDFDEFVKHLEETGYSAFEDLKMADITVIEKLTPESVEAFMNHFAEMIITYSAGYSTILLRAYHEWLQENS